MRRYAALQKAWSKHPPVGFLKEAELSYKAPKDTAALDEAKENTLGMAQMLLAKEGRLH